MATTDRMSDLNTRREITDRLGETVVLGNSVEDGALEIPAQIVAADFGGSSEAESDFNLNAVTSMDLTNGSFGIWAVFWDIDTAAQLQASGAAIGSGRLLESMAAALTWSADAMLLNIRVFTAVGAQTYTPTAGTAKIVVHAMGGGAGGGGCEATTLSLVSCAGGGGAGAYGMAIITSGFSGQTITIGAAGSGGAAGNNFGIAGSATSFGSLLIAGGGSPGQGDSAGGTPRGSAPGAGGSCSGSASLFGATGQSATTAFCGTPALVVSGGGGNSIYGAGGAARISGGGSADGTNGSGFGAGGGGACGINNIARPGGSGAAGIMIIYEYNA